MHLSAPPMPDRMLCSKYDAAVTSTNPPVCFVLQCFDSIDIFNYIFVISTPAPIDGKKYMDQMVSYFSAIFITRKYLNLNPGSLGHHHPF